MGEKDILEKKLLMFNDVFADFVNGIMFDGKDVVKEDELVDLSGWSHYKGDDSKHRFQDRDVVKLWKKENVVISLIGIENQDIPDKNMVFRVLSYDGASYRTQLVEEESRKRKKNAGIDGELQDIFPVITFVIYYGEEEWRHETTLHKRLNLGSELKHYVSDYSINLIDLKKLSEDDIPPLANFCKIIYNNYRNVTKLLKHLGGTMRIKIITFGCILLAGMMIGSGVKTVKAEETVATDSAIEAVVDEVKSEKVEILPENKLEEVEVEEAEEEIEAEEDETPLGSADDKKPQSKKKTTKNSSKKTVKKLEKTEKTEKAANATKQSKDVIKYTDEEFKILVCVTFLEAGNQSYKGKLATANAVINRVLNKRFPNTIKGVIYQKYAGRYQFALCAPGGKLDQAMKNYGKNTGWRAAYEKACIKVVKDALAGKTATDRRYHFFRLHYKGIENWKSDGVKIDDTYYYNY